MKCVAREGDVIVRGRTSTHLSPQTDAVVVDGDGGRGDNTTRIHPPLRHKISFPIENSSTEAGNVEIVIAITIAVDPLLPLHCTHLWSIQHDQLGVAVIVVAAMVAVHE